MTSEHAYQAMKFNAEDARNMVLRANSAHDAKGVAHSLSKYIRPDWHDVKLEIMEEICRAKLEQHGIIRDLLRATGSAEIIEDSPTDSFWGWGPDKKGKNHLGKIWMKLRAEME